MEKPEVKMDKLDWLEYKTMRQYHSVGDLLDDCRIYGFNAGVENMLNKELSSTVENGHDWLTRDPQN